MRHVCCVSLLAVALLAPLSSVMAEEVYRSVDDKGRVIFSDRPSDGAKPVEVGPSNTMTQAAPMPGTGKPGSPEAARPYTLVAISSPTDGSTVTDQLGNITVAYTIEPQRRAEDAVRLLVDGEPAGINTSEGVQVKGLARGDHRLQIQVVNREGRLLGQSGTVRILMVRPGGKHGPG